MQSQVHHVALSEELHSGSAVHGAWLCSVYIIHRNPTFDYYHGRCPVREMLPVVKPTNAHLLHCGVGRSYSLTTVLAHTIRERGMNPILEKNRHTHDELGNTVGEGALVRANNIFEQDHI